MRNNNDLAIPVINSQFGRRSVIYNGPKLWNDMPETIRSLPSISSFKSNTKKHLLLKEKILMHKLICPNNVIFKLHSFIFFILIFSIESHNILFIYSWIHQYLYNKMYIIYNITVFEKYILYTSY